MVSVVAALRPVSKALSGFFRLFPKEKSKKIKKSTCVFFECIFFDEKKQRSGACRACLPFPIHHLSPPPSP